MSDETGECCDPSEVQHYLVIMLKEIAGGRRTRNSVMRNVRAWSFERALLANNIDPVLARQWVNMWVRGIYIDPCTNRLFKMEKARLPMKDSQDLYSVFTYYQIMSALNVFTIEQLKYIIRK